MGQLRCLAFLVPCRTCHAVPRRAMSFWPCRAEPSRAVPSAPAVHLHIEHASFIDHWERERANSPEFLEAHQCSIGQQEAKGGAFPPLDQALTEAKGGAFPPPDQAKGGAFPPLDHHCAH